MEKYMITSRKSFKYLSSTAILFSLIFLPSILRAQFVNAPFKSALVTSHANNQAGVSNVNKNIKFGLTDASSTYNTTIAFDRNSSENVGFEDETLFEEGAVSISTLSADNVALTVNSLPEITKVTEIKLNVNSKKSQTVNLNIADFGGTENWGIILTDSYLNKELDLKVDQSYSFEINKEDSSTFGFDSFKITLIPPASSPMYAVSNFSSDKSKIESGSKLITKNVEKGSAPQILKGEKIFSAMNIVK